VFRQTKGVAEERSESRSFRIIPLICATLTIALGLLTFIGWISGLPLLASVRATYIPMAPSTGLLLFLDWHWTDCALAEGGAALASSSLRLTRSRNGVREIGRGFWWFPFRH
jgi:hypothetical protein